MRLRKNPADMSFLTLMNEFYGVCNGDFLHWTFAFDNSAFVGKWGGRMPKP